MLGQEAGHPVMQPGQNLKGLFTENDLKNNILTILKLPPPCIYKNATHQEKVDEYHLEPDSYPHPDNHAFVISSIEDQVLKFHEQVLDELRNDPCQAIPALY